MLSKLWIEPCTVFKFLCMFSSVQFSCLVVSNSLQPMDCSTPGLPVHCQLLQFTQTHVHWVSDAIQPSHPLPSPSPPALNLPLLASIFPSIRVFSNESALRIRWQKYWNFSFNISHSNEHPGLVGSPCSPRDSQEFSPTPQFKSINSSVLSFLCSPTLTSIHDYWKNHCLDKTNHCW